MSHFDEFTIEAFSSFITRFKWHLLDKLPSEKFVKAFLDTKMNSWLPVIKQALVLHDNAVTMTDGAMILHGNHEPITMFITDVELEQKMKDLLINWMNEPS
jgi:hypothetical protein